MSQPTAKTINHHEIFRWYEQDTAVFLDHRATARINVATNAIQTLTSVLMQKEVDQDGMTENALTMDHRVSIGLLEALACCAELVRETVNGHSHGDAFMGITSLPADSAGADLMRQTARKATTMRRSSDKGEA